MVEPVMALTIMSGQNTPFIIFGRASHIWKVSCSSLSIEFIIQGKNSWTLKMRCICTWQHWFSNCFLMAKTEQDGCSSAKETIETEGQNKNPIDNSTIKTISMQTATVEFQAFQLSICLKAFHSANNLLCNKPRPGIFLPKTFFFHGIRN